MYHGLGDIDALLVVAHEASPAGHPSEGAFDDPASPQDLEAGLFIDAPDDLDDEVEEGRLVHQLGAMRCLIQGQRLRPTVFLPAS